ncbi:hypothetical protein [Kitasatospora sp. NPDC057198]|uniref:DUF7674 family protein n=1 Tax=Kitasatospora sp. NPDC057198 TaxID=3346046 RepID=UPI003630C943
MSEDVQLVEELVARIPGFQDLYETHIFNNDSLLPHPFFWEVTQETVSSYLGDAESPDWQQTLQFLEEQAEKGVPEIDKVIVTSFLYNLPFPGSPGHDIVDHLGPVLTRRFAELRPGG